MGNPTQQATVKMVANHKVWLEDNAIQQLHTTAQLPHIQAAVGLPDLHAGRGYPIGAAFFSSQHFYPALVGGDIGCGMACGKPICCATKYRAASWPNNWAILMAAWTATIYRPLAAI